jgi:Predicted nucleotide kinase (related to CMP and AMP kinases)
VGDVLAKTPYVRYIPELDTYEAQSGLSGKTRGPWCIWAVAPGDVVDTHAVELSPGSGRLWLSSARRPTFLYRELAERGWPSKKILDNVWAEMLDVVYIKAVERWGEVVQIDVTRRTPEETFEVLKLCVGEKRCSSDEVDWLGYAEKTGFLDFIERLSR